MQNTSTLWKNIVRSGEYETENLLKIEDNDGNMVAYDESQIESIDIRRFTFKGQNLAIGCACASNCHIVLISDILAGKDLSRDIPKGARIEIYERITGYVNGYRQTSEWLVQGVFYVDSRESTAWTGRLTLDGIDSMVKADANYPGSGEGWPTEGKIDTYIVNTICGQMGVNLSQYTVLDKGYMIPFPGTYTMREVLCYIAAMYGGNWVIDKAGELLLMRLGDFPAESYNLITEDGDAITITSNGYHIKINGGVFVG